MNILIVGNIYFDLPSQVSGHNVRVIKFLKQTNISGRALRWLYIKENSKSQLKYFGLEECVQLAKKSDVVILFDSTSTIVLNEYLSAIEKAVDISVTKLYFYFWNTIKCLDSLKISSNWNLVTYDKIDSEKYGIRYIGGFYHPVPIKSSSIVDTDVCFVGRNKGRFKILSDIERLIKSIGLRTNFVYVDNLKSLFNKKYSKYIPYSKIVDILIRSRAIIDITATGQYGLTLRFYESLFYHKKIITNTVSVKEYKFYNPENILILDDRISSTDFLKFINDDYCSTDEPIIKQYHFSSWLERLLDSSIVFNDTTR